jgi:hypothetical protein
MHKDTLILTFSHGEKELLFGTSKFARRLPLPLGEGWGEGMLIGPRNP